MLDSPGDRVRRSLLAGEVGQNTGNKRQNEDFQVAGGPIQGTSPRTFESSPILSCPVPTHSTPPLQTTCLAHTRSTYPVMPHLLPPQ